MYPPHPTPRRTLAVGTVAASAIAAGAACGNPYPACLAATVAAAWFGGGRTCLAVTACIAALGLIQRPDQEPRPVAMSAARGPVNVALVGVVIAALTDAIVAAQRRSEATEAERQADAERHRLLFEASPLPMWVHDADSGQVLAANEAAIQLCGYPREEFLTMTIASLLASAVDPDPEEDTNDHPGGSAPDGPRRLRRRDGIDIDLRLSVRPFDWGGRPSLLVLATDDSRCKWAERALRRSEARLRRVVDSNPVGVAFLDDRGRVTDANEAFLRLTGYERGDLADDAIDWLHIAPPLPGDPEPLGSRGTVPGREIARTGRALIRKDGARIPALIGEAGLADGGDERTCFALDLSELHRSDGNLGHLLAAERAAHAATRQAGRRYRRLAQAIPQIVLVANGVGSVDYLNSRWTRYTGMEKPQSLGRGWQSALHPEDRGRLLQAWERAQELGEAITLDLRLRRHDGSYRWHLLQALPSRHRTGGSVRWLGTFTDIDALKSAKGALAFLAECGALLAASLADRAIPEGLARLLVPRVADLCHFDLIDDCGDLRRMAAARVDASRPDGIRVLAGGPIDPEGDHPSARVLRSGRPEWANRVDDPKVRSGLTGTGLRPDHDAPGAVSYISVPLVSRGRALGVITLAMAPSGRHYTAADLALAEQVARRVSIALDNARLYRDAERARGEAEDANRAKDRFLAVLSHELRTPLTPVLMAASALLDDQETPAALKPTLEMICRNVGLEARLIEDLLDVTRIGAGKLQLERRSTNLHAVIWEAIETCRHEVRAAGLDLEVDLGASEHHVKGDPARLQQVAWNLLKNAAKFTPSGGRLLVRTVNAPPDEGHGRPRLVVAVEDTGIGIDPEALPRVFGAFEQGDAEPVRGRGGLGLGLAIAHAVADAHGGRLTARSEGRGRGSTFSLELPTDPAAADEAPPPPPRQAADRPARQALRILLVEDNKDTLRNIAQALQLRGHIAVPAESLAAGLKAARLMEYDLIVSDIQLPDGSGLDLMRELGRTGEVPGIAMSGYGTEDDVRESLAAGFAEHLTKPVTFQALEEAIHRVAPVACGYSAVTAVGR
jgi:PAS domain S-box-containing protein